MVLVMLNGVASMELDHQPFITGQFVLENKAVNFLSHGDEPDVHPVCIEAPSNSQPLILEMNGAKLTIPNGIDTLLLSQVISAMKGSLC